MAADDCWLEDLFVRDEDRRKGLGEQLVALALERARARGCGRVELDVSESNRGAWVLYERMGFSPGYKPPAPNVLMGSSSEPPRPAVAERLEAQRAVEQLALAGGVENDGLVRGAGERCADAPPAERLRHVHVEQRAFV